jgi:tetratricopeptide (TPR) repeat protein
MKVAERARRRGKKAPGGSGPSASPVDRERSERRRLLRLLALLLLAAALYGATGSWRQRLREESARSRRVIAAVEGARSAHLQRTERERDLAGRLRAQPEDADARLELAQLRWRTGGPRAAAALIEAGASESDPRLVQMLAAAQRAAGREDRALATLERGLRLGFPAPWPGVLQAERATVFTLLGWFPQAEAALREAEKSAAPPLQTALVHATIARQNVDSRTARRVLEAARARHPEDADVVRQLAAVAEGERRFDEATALFRSIAEREGDPRIWVALGRIALQRDEPEGRSEAKGFLQRALALQPGMPAARLLLARGHRLDGDLAGARAILEPLCRERPHLGVALFELTQVYRALGENDRARPLLARYGQHARRRREMLQAANAVMTSPESAQAHARIGRLCLDEGRIGRAILSLERALALQPGLPGARATLDRARRAADTAAADDE